MKKKAIDRFIPNRKASKFKIAFTAAHENNENLPEKQIDYTLDKKTQNFSMIYKNEILGVKPNPFKKQNKFENTNIFKFFEDPKKNTIQNKENSLSFEFNEELSASLIKNSRKIPKVPYKVLDAPALQDDFYLNLIDWSSQNILAVGLGSCVYLWSAVNSKVVKLCDLGTDSVASVSWSLKGNYLSVGTSAGEIQLWDTVKTSKFKSLCHHTSRVGTLCWTSSCLTSGSRDKSIIHSDLRLPIAQVFNFQGHKQEICGIKWSPDEQTLASGGNDNKIFLWSLASPEAALHKFTQHCAAVKALSWSPHQHGVLASGGGTADKTIRFWNALTFENIITMDTGSQICNLLWSKDLNEVISSHGYSQNQINIFRYPSLDKIATLTGHTYRVLYLSMNKEGDTVVSGAGDETLRFWNICGKREKREEREISGSRLGPKNSDLR